MTDPTIPRTANGDPGHADEIFRLKKAVKAMDDQLRSSQRHIRILKTIAAGNHALVRATTEDELFQGMCRVIVEIGGYCMAWVGQVEHDEDKTVRPLAHAGHEAGYLALSRISWGDTPLGHGPTGMAARTGATQFNNDFTANPVMGPWTEAALQRGYRSNISLPLTDKAGVFGALTIYADEPNAFGPEEVALLSQLAGDISYGATALRTRRDHDEMKQTLRLVEERRQAEEAQRRSEERFRLLVEQALDGIFVSDAAGRYVDVNSAGQMMLGYTRDEILSRTFADVLAPEEASRLAPLLAELAEGHVTRSEWRFRRKDGSEILGEVVGQRLPDGQLLGIVRDITERKQAEQALRASEQRMKLATEATEVGIWEWNVKTGAIVWDDQMFRIYGIPPTSDRMVSYETWAGAVLPEDLPREAALLQKTVRDGGINRRSFRLQRGDNGEIRVIQAVETRRADAQGETEWVVGTNLDITELKVAEQTLRNSEKSKSFLLGLNDRLKFLDDPLEMMAAAAEWLGRSIGAHQVVYGEIDPDEEIATILREWNAGPIPSNLGVHRLVDFGAGFVADLQAGKTVAIDDIAKDSRVAQASFRARLIGGIMSVPLASRLHVMSVHSRDARNWSALDVSFAEETAERTWAAVERARSTQEALASENMLEAALLAMPDAVVITDAQGRSIHCNDACATFHRIMGGAECSRNCVGCADLSEAFTIDGEPIPLDQQPVARALRGETDVAVVTVLRQKDTGEKWLGSYSFAPIRDEAGAVVGSVVTARDITAQRRAEEDLRDHQRQLKAIFETSMEGIVTIDSKGIIKGANPAAAEMFGYPADELLGLNVSILMPEPHKARHDFYIAHYLQTGEKSIIGYRRRLKGLRRNGETFPKELTVTKAEIDHEVLFIGFMRDLSPIEDEKRRVSELREELARVSRMNDMGQVVAGLAHEIGQPLAAIGNFGAAGRRMLAAGDASLIAEVIDKIEAQSRRGGEILSRLRDFIGKREGPERTQESLGLLVADAMSLSALRYGGHPPSVLFELLDAEVAVDVDRVQIQQVLVNFLRNAADAAACEQKPEIVVTTDMDRPGSVRVSVSDNGPGVGAEVAAQLFSPFVTTKKFGMGVGLSLCKSIIENHGGEIGFRANDPRGAVFFFTLPISKRPEVDDPGPELMSAM